MKKNIWQELKQNKQPFFVLAPMDDVTDTVFRRMVAAHAAADVMMTEFANADGWCSPGKQAIGTRLQHEKSERPLIAQVWGITPAHYEQMAQDIVEMGFDGIDINMGCPVKDMIKKGACSAMIQTPLLAQEVIEATRKGVAGKVPVSVKTRIGFNEADVTGWIGFLLEQNLDAITIHGRTKSEMSKVPARWDEIA
ncbi:tRNA-dihydrouridine synthase, partial [Candidatus Saccharibacteria bacterium]|nr:tRNA-dihydrouridine synthase [Candidatus Saccharibacteria bacterium]